MSKKSIIYIIIAVSAVALISGVALVLKEKQDKPPQTEKSTKSTVESQTVTQPNMQDLFGESKSDYISKLLSDTKGVLSPDRSKIAFISEKNGKPEVWVVESDGSKKRKVSKLENGHGARVPIWSPDGSLIAFTSYNLEGHSPLTTTHVWGVRPDGSNPKKVVLPSPYSRFSTYEPEFLPNGQLLVKALTLESKEKLYIYDYEKGKISKYNK